MRSDVWDDRGLQRTNPVHALDQMLLDLEPQFAAGNGHGCAERVVQQLEAEGASVPSFAIENFKQRGWLREDFPVPATRPRVGVVGLAVDTRRRAQGYVLPLDCRRLEQGPGPFGWQVDGLLPFDAHKVLDALVTLIHHTALHTAGLIPERLAFGFTNPLGIRAYGNSMTMAAVLAVLDELGGRRAELLSCATAVVEPLLDGRLEPVKGIVAKLRALVREHGGWSLLVAPAGCVELDEFRGRHGPIWEVADFHDLAARLHGAGLLAELLAKVTPREVIRLMANLLFAHDRKQLSKGNVIRTVYDPCCGSGGMLTIAKEHIQALNPSAEVHLFGQEVNPQTFAVCKSDLFLISADGRDADNVAFGSVFSQDGHADRSFDYLLANPPYGKDWSLDQEVVRAEAALEGNAGVQIHHDPPAEPSRAGEFVQVGVAPLHPLLRDLVSERFPALTGLARRGHLLPLRSPHGRQHSQLGGRVVLPRRRVKYDRRNRRIPLAARGVPQCDLPPRGARVPR